MKKRNSYHTGLKEAVRLGLISEKFKENGTFSKASWYRWLKEPEDKYVGAEFSNLADKQLEAIRVFKEFPKTLYAYARIVKTYMNIINSTHNIKQVLKDNKQQVVDAIIKTRKTLGLKKVLKAFQLNSSTFHNWAIEAKMNCEKSFLKVCNKLRPLQLPLKDVNIIKDMLTNPKFEHWPISSIQAFAVREKILFASLSTWFRYNRAFQFRKPLPIFRKVSKNSCGCFIFSYLPKAIDTLKIKKYTNRRGAHGSEWSKKQGRMNAMKWSEEP